MYKVTVCCDLFTEYSLFNTYKESIDFATDCYMLGYKCTIEKMTKKGYKLICIMSEELRGT